MKLATYLGLDGAAAVGVVTDDRIVDLRATAARHGRDAAPFATMLALIDAGPAALDAARDLAEREAVEVPLAGTTLLAPVPEPRQLRDCSVFETHVRQGIAAINRAHERAGRAAGPTDPALVTVPAVYRERPIYYKGNRFSVVGHEHDVQWPSHSERLDFELEFGVFLGRRGRNVPAAQADAHIFGFTIFNDVSARDTQAAEMAGMLGPAKGKDFDTGNVLGPWIVTPDEMGNVYDLTMEVAVNGERWATGNSRDMMHSFAEIIAYVSRDETLHPGEFIGSGTVGNGCGLELDRWVRPGDVIELMVERIGTLRNRVVRAAPPGA